MDCFSSSSNHSSRSWFLDRKPGSRPSLVAMTRPSTASIASSAGNPIHSESEDSKRRTTLGSGTIVV